MRQRDFRDLADADQDTRWKTGGRDGYLITTCAECGQDVAFVRVQKADRPLCLSADDIGRCADCVFGVACVRFRPAAGGQAVSEQAALF